MILSFNNKKKRTKMIRNLILKKNDLDIVI